MTFELHRPDRAREDDVGQRRDARVAAVPQRVQARGHSQEPIEAGAVVGHEHLAVHDRDAERVAQPVRPNVGRRRVRVSAARRRERVPGVWSAVERQPHDLAEQPLRLLAGARIAAVADPDIERIAGHPAAADLMRNRGRLPGERRADLDGALGAQRERTWRRLEPRDAVPHQAVLVARRVGDEDVAVRRVEADAREATLTSGVGQLRSRH